MKVTLEWAEMRLACAVGVARQMDALKKNRAVRLNDPRDNKWSTHIEGACGEMAVAKALGIYWNGSMGRIDADDVGPYQVRTTFDGGRCLLTHPDDKDDKPYILVTGPAPDFVVRGWLFGRDTKLPEYWRDPSGKNRWAYFVPQSKLRPISELPHEATLQTLAAE